MPVIDDPEGIAISLLHKMAPFDGKRVFEIGCGDGRMTWGFAEEATHVTAIDPLPEDIRAALQDTPDHLKERLDFVEVGIEDYELPDSEPKFDIALFTWSL
jgi:ubiquinone/menaquinone biosynthesis C-methylase UbiE